jgi:hypothetical protein
MTLINILDNEALTLDDVCPEAERAYFCVYIKDEDTYIVDMSERCTRGCNPNSVEL